MVLEIIIWGETPILYVAGIAEGKSFAFFLPANYSPEGTIIVIVPLLFLRTDLVRRYIFHGLSSHVW